MGRGETSDVSGIPTLNRLLTDIDEVKGSHTKAQTEFDDFKKVIDEKVDEEIRLVSTSIVAWLRMWSVNIGCT